MLPSRAFEHQPSSWRSYIDPVQTQTSHMDALSSGRAGDSPRGGGSARGNGHGYGISYLNVYHGGGQVKRMRWWTWIICDLSSAAAVADAASASSAASAIKIKSHYGLEQHLSRGNASVFLNARRWRWGMEARRPWHIPTVSGSPSPSPRSRDRIGSARVSLGCQKVPWDGSHMRPLGVG